MEDVENYYIGSCFRLDVNMSEEGFQRPSLEHHVCVKNGTRRTPELISSRFSGIKPLCGAEENFFFV